MINIKQTFTLKLYAVPTFCFVKTSEFEDICLISNIQSQNGFFSQK